MDFDSHASPLLLPMRGDAPGCHRNLLVVRAGDGSLHPGWVAAAEPRDFDILVSYYGETPGRFRDGAEHYHAMPGPRWPAHDAICRDMAAVLDGYDHICFACDDLIADQAAWSALFAVCATYGLDLAQPGIEGEVGHEITRAVDGYFLRATNFIEIMCPVFSRRALELLKSSFCESVSGWGLELLWQALLQHLDWRVAIVDSVRVGHQRPLQSGTLYQTLATQGLDAKTEFFALRERFGLPALYATKVLHAMRGGPPLATTRAGAPARWRAEALVKELHAGLSPGQRDEICFPWDYADARRGLLRSFVSNHWQVTEPSILGAFYSAAQQETIYEIFKLLLAPGCVDYFMRQLAEDTNGHDWGQDQSIAIIGDPEVGPYQFLLTGRHLTLRADGGSSPCGGLGGPVFYGHAAGGFYESEGHETNIFLPQAAVATELFNLLPPPLRGLACAAALPAEHDLAFAAQPRGLPVASFSRDQKACFARLIQTLLSIFRTEDRQRILQCLGRQGGFDRLRIAYAAERIASRYRDVWRIEGPAFVWHFNGVPHVHSWVRIAAAPAGEAANGHKGAVLFSGQDPLL